MSRFCLVKMVENKDYADDFRAGELFANSLSHYHDPDLGMGRFDSNEGVFPVPIDDSTEVEVITSEGPVSICDGLLSMTHHPLQLACVKVVCMQVVSTDALKQGTLENFQDSFGTHAVVVTDPQSFVDRIMKAIRQHLILGRVSRGGQGLVTYAADNLTSHLLVRTYHLDLKLAFVKQNEFQHQSEYRIVLDTGMFPDGPYRLNIGDISDITTYSLAVDLASRNLSLNHSWVPIPAITCVDLMRVAQRHLRHRVLVGGGYIHPKHGTPKVLCTLKNQHYSGKLVRAVHHCNTSWRSHV